MQQQHLGSPSIRLIMTGRVIALGPGQEMIIDEFFEQRRLCCATSSGNEGLSRERLAVLGLSLCLYLLSRLRISGELVNRLAFDREFKIPGGLRSAFRSPISFENWHVLVLRCLGVVRADCARRAVSSQRIDAMLRKSVKRLGLELESDAPRFEPRPDLLRVES